MRAVKYIFIKKPLAFHVHSEVVISIALNIRRTKHLARATWRDKSLNIADANTAGTLKSKINWFILSRDTILLLTFQVTPIYSAFLESVFLGKIFRA